MRALYCQEKFASAYSIYTPGLPECLAFPGILNSALASRRTGNMARSSEVKWRCIMHSLTVK